MSPAQSQVDDNTFTVLIDHYDLPIDKEEIIRTLGYTANIPEHFNDVLNEILEEAPKLCSINAGYTITNYSNAEKKGDGAFIGGKFFNLHKIVTGQLKKSEKAILFLCSIGGEMEKWSKKILADGDPMFGFLIDTVASHTVEATADLLHDHIRSEMMKLGLNITNRYSPGYCNWSVAEQHLLFSFFPEKFCGVSLTESALMMPVKSVSGIIGAGKNVKYREYLCDSCGVKDCTYRSKRTANSRSI